MSGGAPRAGADCGGTRGSLMVTEVFSFLIVGFTSCIHLLNLKLYTLNRWVLFHINYSLMKLS